VQEEIFPSSFAAAAYLKSVNFPSNKKVYVVGEGGIQLELTQAGISHIGGPVFLFLLLQASYIFAIT
jgi:phosphoglycolate phosphatase